MADTHHTLTVERLKELLHYDPETGVFTWRFARKGTKAGAIAGATNSCGYRIISVDMVRYGAHRLAWLYIRGRFPEQNIDHIDRVCSNNRISNLRCASKTQNAYNRGPSPNTTSGRKGVSKHTASGKWQVSARIDGVSHWLGRFSDIETATRAYKEFVEEHHGRFLCV